MHAGVHVRHYVLVHESPQFASTACRCKLGHEALGTPVTSCYANQFGKPPTVD